MSNEIGKTKSELEREKKLKQLSFWEQDDSHSAPNIVSRSPLFSPLKNCKDSERKVLDSKDTFIAWGRKMSISGKQLDESDKDVFMELVRIGKLNASEHVIFSRRKLLLSIGKSASGPDYQWLRESIDRLTETTFTYYPDHHSDDTGVKINLIQAAGWDGDQMFVRVGEEMKILFERNQYALINMEKRNELKNQLAKWLYDFIRANETGMKHFKVKTIQQTCGRGGSRPNVFRQSLITAMKELALKDKTFKFPRVYQKETNVKTWMFSYVKERSGSEPRVPHDLQ